MMKSSDNKFEVLADRQSSPVIPIFHPQTGGYGLLLTEEELISLLRIPEVSKARDYHSVVQNLMRMHDLPCIHIAKQPLFPIDAVRRWITDKAKKESMR